MCVPRSETDEAEASFSYPELDRLLYWLVDRRRSRDELVDAEVIEGDATAVDFDEIAPAAEGPWKLVANLPYNIATPLLIGWLSAEPWPPWFDMMALMFQREVAERIVAELETARRSNTIISSPLMPKRWKRLKLNSYTPLTFKIPIYNH